MKEAKTNKKLPSKDQAELLKVLKARFEKNVGRHQALKWAEVEARLEAAPEKLWSLQQMETTGGEPDVVGQDAKSKECLFFDCSEQAPSGRRSFCYDPEALASRKEHKPKHSAAGLAAEMGVELLTEEQYLELQKLGHFDTKTSCWLKTPAEMRKLGGALFAERRYNRVFVCCNGAESYYAARAFRGALRV